MNTTQLLSSETWNIKIKPHSSGIVFRNVLKNVLRKTLKLGTVSQKFLIFLVTTSKTKS